MSKGVEKRTVDMQVIGEWVEPNSRVLDLGCGRGELMAYLVQAKGVSAVGVDLDINRISACVARGLSAYQGDMTEFMRAFPDRSFGRVICSRTAHELADPAGVILEALRVADAVTVGFVNHGFWKNRVNTLLRGRKIRNSVYTTPWHESSPANHLTIADFEDFCREKSVRVARRAVLLGDWKTHCPFAPNLLAGYALYDLARP
ncbi:MAG TPA: methionine biosynthesis protein MetW [Opitutaceae bacterium]|jgi:methionine biosynthesis protein MetW